MIQLNEESHSNDNIEVAMYDAETVQSLPEWDELTDTERLQLLQEEEPEDSFTVHNVTTDDYREHIAALADRNTTTSPSVVDFIAIGDSDSLESPTDSVLGNEHTRKRATDIEDIGGELQTITLFSTDEGVGEDFIEAGLFDSSSGGMMFNRVLLEDDSRLRPKTQDYAVTIKINIQYLDASQV